MRMQTRVDRQQHRIKAEQGADQAAACTPLGARLPRLVVLFVILVTSRSVLGLIDFPIDLRWSSAARRGCRCRRCGRPSMTMMRSASCTDGNTLGDDDLGGLGDVLAEALADQGIGAGIHRAGGVVQDEDLGLLQQGAGNAQALLLAAGDVGAALFDLGVVLVGELLDELIGLGQAGRPPPASARRWRRDCPSAGCP